MIEIKTLATPSPIQWGAIIHGMRNPHNSWDKSDSTYTSIECGEYEYSWVFDSGDILGFDFEIGANFKSGEADRNLMKTLCKAGTDHRKFIRMINVYADITAPLYWWKEFDTYKVGTVRNSCSTMHTITKREFDVSDFSCENLSEDYEKFGAVLRDTEDLETDIAVTPKSLMNVVIGCLNLYRSKYIETGDKDCWWQIIQLLPSSYNQRATVMMNYEVLRNMYHSRKNHPLREWREFCKWIETLPYSELITGKELEK